MGCSLSEYNFEGNMYKTCLKINAETLMNRSKFKLGKLWQISKLLVSNKEICKEETSLNWRWFSTPNNTQIYDWYISKCCIKRIFFALSTFEETAKKTTTLDSTYDLVAF